MTTQILASVSREPPLLRWLHSHDPDRDLSVDLLKASATYTTSVPQADTADIFEAPLPPTTSLFVPMYRRKHFVLGQLYGPMSPNGMALNMLAQAGYGKPPDPISRRFVVDLSFQSSLSFIEYEWFSDGKLCVSMHYVTAAGGYQGESILLDSPVKSEDGLLLCKEDLLPGTNRRPSPTKVIMRMRITEDVSCRICGNKNDFCACSPSVSSLASDAANFVAPTSWETWLFAFGASRVEMANMNMQFSMITPMGNVEGSKGLRLQQDCEVGVEPSSPRGNLLLKMFMQSAGMLVSHPTTDTPVVAAEERRDRIELANDLSNDENWASPRVFVLDIEAPAVHPLSTVRDDSADAGASSTVNDSEDNIWQPGTTAISSQSSVLEEEPAFPKACVTPNLNASIGTSGIAIGKHLPEERKLEPAPIDVVRGIQKETKATKRKGKQNDKLFVCECGKVFTHKGHYNEHRLCVHEKVRHHKCSFVNCQSRFFKKSDRDRHMRSKHDSAAVLCSTCEAALPDKDALDVHMRQEHPNERKFACSKCSSKYDTSTGLRLHMPKCRAVT